ncbi:MAG: branched-chain amino acid ABC transporter permease [Chloroflexi bacterium]|nr:branched-chain amino acid ABC transporter permease [Chloroflexota bacterium]
MDAQKYAIRKVVGLPGASIRILLEKAKSSAFIAAIAIAVVIAIVLVILYCGVPGVFKVLTGDGRDKLTGALLSGLMWGGMYSIIALGMVVVYKATRVLNMAAGGMLQFLTFLAWWLLAVGDNQSYVLITLGLIVAVMAIRITNRRQFGQFGVAFGICATIGFGIFVWGELSGDHLTYWWLRIVGLTILTFAAVVFGLYTDRLVFRGMIGASPLMTFMLAVFFGFLLLHGGCVLVFEGKSQIMPQLFPSGTIEVGNYRLPWDLLSAFITGTLLFVIFVLFFRFTKTGLAMRCVSENSVVSQSLGIYVKRVYAIAWVVGALTAAIGGILLATKTAVYSESGGMGIYGLFRALPVMVLGGLESIGGCFLAALIVGLTEQLSGAYIDPYIPQFRAIMPYVLLLVIIIVRPHGLFGLKGIRRI